jgi:AraC-like DNA-binding protein
VREVALAVGYRQPAQFAKAFRREVGMSLSAFSAKAPEVRAHMTREQYSRLDAVFADPGQSSPLMGALGLSG